MTLRHSDTEINEAISEYLASQSTGCPIRVRAVAETILGPRQKIPSVLSARIRTLAAARGYRPDPNDHTAESRNRLYKGGKP